MHYMPRLLRIDGSVIRHQLAGNRMLDHELVSAVVRRQSQLDKESMSESLYMSYPHLFEPDFLTVALADVEITSLMNIQNQFVGESIQYPLESCQFFYTPMLLEERWILIMWDMLWMLIHVVTSDLNKEHYDLIAL